MDQVRGEKRHLARPRLQLGGGEFLLFVCFGSQGFVSLPLNDSNDT